MSLIPQEETQPRGWVNLTPMVDFLFVIIAVFAILAITRTALFDSEINLASIKEESLIEEPLQGHTINLSVTHTGTYKWITEFTEYGMDGIPSLLQELSKQEKLGLLPQDPAKTTILLHIDKKAEWDPIVQLIYSLKKTGYLVHPVYEKTLDKNKTIIHNKSS